MPYARTPQQKKKLSKAYRICKSKKMTKKKTESCVYQVYNKLKRKK